MDIHTRPLGPLRPLACLLLAVALALQGVPLALAQSAAQSAADKDLIAVLDLEAVGASEAQAVAMTDRLREEMLKTGRYTLVDRSQMEAVLNEQALQQTGCTSQECAVQVGQILGVRTIVAGKVTQADKDTWLLSALMVDAETAETKRAESVQFKGSYFDLLSIGMGLLAAKLADVEPRAELIAEYQALQAKQAAAAETGWPWWAWAGIGVLAVGALAGGGGGGGDSCTSPDGCGGFGFTW